jgi:putative oxidoreductase
VDRARLWGIMLLRVVVGIVFLAHGSQKLFTMGFAGVGRYLAGVGVPAPMPAAVVVTLVEFLGGAALVLGLATRPAALLLAFDMLVAILTVHLPNGFFAPRGVEFPLSLLAANVGLVLTGAGAASLDAVLWGGREDEERLEIETRRRRAAGGA